MVCKATLEEGGGGRAEWALRVSFQVQCALSVIKLLFNQRTERESMAENERKRESVRDSERKRGEMARGQSKYQLVLEVFLVLFTCLARRRADQNNFRNSS